MDCTKTGRTKTGWTKMNWPKSRSTMSLGMGKMNNLCSLYNIKNVVIFSFRIHKFTFHLLMLPYANIQFSFFFHLFVIVLI